MKSDLPKALHPVGGEPIITAVLRAVQQAGATRAVVVVGFGADQIRSALSNQKVEFADQLEQLGTGHAAQMAAPLLQGFRGAILVTPGDTPLITAAAVKRLFDEHCHQGAKVSVATFNAPNAFGYGRIVRVDGQPARIVEHKDATPEELEITEVNSSVYCFDAEFLLTSLPKLSNKNAQGEYYLTDLLAMAKTENHLTHAVVFDDPGIFSGVNDRVQLAEADKALRKRINDAHMANGVTLVDPEATYIGQEVTIGRDTIIEPGCMISGSTVIGSHCHIGPNSKLADSKLGDHVEVLMSHLNGAVMEDHTRCGPFANLRPGAILRTNAKVGNFVEIKNAELGEGVAASHLSYIGDASVGANANVGAGTITCNYDGYRKHRTIIGKNAFVGSNSTLVAPVTIGDGAFIAAGSVVTRDSAADSLIIGRANQVEKEQWAVRWRKKNEEHSR